MRSESGRTSPVPLVAGEAPGTPRFFSVANLPMEAVKMTLLCRNDDFGGSRGNHARVMQCKRALVLLLLLLSCGCLSH
jgi:hypothetical protein